MSWREAFLRQARSENAVRRRLNDPAVEYSHRLHYLQMVAEKLGKAVATDNADPDPPAPRHQSLVRLLQGLKRWPRFRQQLGYHDAMAFRAFIDSILPLASEIEQLAPSAAGLECPNPEYPWRDRATGIVHAPADFAFPAFDPHDPRMAKFERLLTALLRIAD